MANVTLSIDKTLLKWARIVALKHDTTVNAMIRDFLEREVSKHEKSPGPGTNCMNGNYFLDTNILVYIHDLQSPEKQKISKHLQHGQVSMKLP